MNRSILVMTCARATAVEAAAADTSALLHFEGSLVLMFRDGAGWALSDRGSAT